MHKWHNADNFTELIYHGDIYVLKKLCVFYCCVFVVVTNINIQNQHDAFLSGVSHFSFPIWNIQYFPGFTIVGLWFYTEANIEW